LDCADVENKIAQSEKSPKNSLKECVFLNTALKIQCHVVKNTLLQLFRRFRPLRDI